MPLPSRQLQLNISTGTALGRSCACTDALKETATATADTAVKILFIVIYLEVIRGAPPAAELVN